MLTDAPLSPETIEFLPGDVCSRLDIAALFPGRETLPVEADLGCGDGAFLTAMAALHPERNFLGVERLLGRVRRTCRKLAAGGARNARLIRLESHYLVRYLLPPGSVHTIHVMFPDPWPKRRHHGNRLIQKDFLDVAWIALAPGGEIRLTTDDAPYFAHMRRVFEPHPGFVEEPWEPGPDYPRTDFEALFRARALPIYRARLRKRG